MTLQLQDNSGDKEQTLSSSTGTEAGIAHFSLLACDVIGLKMLSHYAFGLCLGE